VRGATTVGRLRWLRRPPVATLVLLAALVPCQLALEWIVADVGGMQALVGPVDQRSIVAGPCLAMLLCVRLILVFMAPGLILAAAGELLLARRGRGKQPLRHEPGTDSTSGSSGAR